MNDLILPGSRGARGADLAGEDSQLGLFFFFFLAARTQRNSQWPYDADKTGQTPQGFLGERFLA